MVMSSPGRRQASPIQTAVVRASNRTSPGNGTPPGLDKPLSLLAENVQRTMAAFYDVHKALLVSRKATPIGVDQFKNAKHVFRVELETLRQVLQNTYRHAIDFAASCQRAPNDRYISAKRCLSSGKAVLRDLQEINRAYSRNLEEFKTHQVELTVFLSQRSKRGQRRPSSYNPDASVLRPETPVSSLYSALGDLQSSLRNILSFWENHCAFLTLVANRQSNFPSPGQETKATIDMWVRYQAALLKCSSSIAQSADAMSVDPSMTTLNGKPHRRQTYPFSEVERRHAQQQASGNPAFHSDQDEESSHWFSRFFKYIFCL